MTLGQSIDEIKHNLQVRDDAGILDFFALEFHKVAQSVDSDLP